MAHKIFTWKSKWPVIKFLLIFCGIISLFYVFSSTVFYVELIFIPYAKINATAVGALLNLLGQHVTVAENSITSLKFSVEIVRGCDAIEPTVFLIAAIVAFPATIKSKLKGILAFGIFLPVSCQA